MNFGPNGTELPVAFTQASRAGATRIPLSWLASVTTQPPAGFVARTGGAPATALSAGNRTGALAPPHPVITYRSALSRANINCALPGGGGGDAGPIMP